MRKATVILCAVTITTAGCSWLDITAPDTGRLYIENATGEMLTFRLLHGNSRMGFPQLSPGEIWKKELPPGEYTIETSVAEPEEVLIERNKAKMVIFREVV